MDIKKTQILSRAEGSFPFIFYIEKAIPSESGSEFAIEGVASSTNVDHDQERMAKPALIRMAKIINEQSVPLRVAHQKTDDAIIGRVCEAHIDDRNQLRIKAMLDKTKPAAMILYDSLKAGAQLGLSVGGEVKDAIRELVESKGKMIKTFYDVMLREVSVTPRPSNYDSWLIAKNYTGTPLEEDIYKSCYNEFLFENPQMDYLQTFEKSIPKNAWQSEKQRVEDNNEQGYNVKLNNNNMFGFNKKESDPKEESSSSSSEASDKEKEMSSDKDSVSESEPSDSESSPTKKAMESSESKSSEKTKTAKEKFPESNYSDSESSSTKKAIVEGINKAIDALSNITKTLSYTSLDSDALDQEIPDEKKEKQREGQEETYANGDNSAPRERSGKQSSESTEALDQEFPSESKTKKAFKSSSSEDSSESESSAKKADNKTSRDSDTYSESEYKAIGGDHAQSKRERGGNEKPDSTEALDQEFPNETKTRKEVSSSESYSVPAGSRMVGDEKDRSSESADTSEYKIPSAERVKAMSKQMKSNPKVAVANIDKFAFLVGEALEKLEKSQEESGNRIIGLRNQFMEFIRNDQKIQKSIKEYMGEPGLKRSVINGTPYVMSRDGGPRLKLVSDVTAEELHKSVSEEKDFKEMYKNNFSSEARRENISQIL